MSRSEQLLSSIVAQNRVSGAYIFYSPDVNSALNGARLLATLLFGEQAKILTEGFVDYREIMSEKSITVDTVRSIQQYVQYGPHNAAFMCVVIHNAHDMTVEASNAFLKSLEEPMPGVCFILTTTHPTRLLQTIVSRCQLLDFPMTTDSLEDTKSLISFSRYCEMPVSDRFVYHAELSRNTDQIFNQLSQWLKDIQTQFSGGETEHLRSLKEIVEIISRLEYNLNHRLQLDALAVNINE